MPEVGESVMRRDPLAWVKTLDPRSTLDLPEPGLL